MTSFLSSCNHLALVILLVTSSFCQAQVQANSITELSFPLLECSGLTEIDGHFITHNDSGDDATLYVFNSLTGTVIREVNITNASHTDWEDICHDDEYIYISDSGNNQGIRTNLKVYKIRIDDFFNTPNENVDAEVINFAYADQTDFSGDNTAHNFDAEALICLGDSLYIFTKNRGDFLSNIYPLSKTPGNYLLNKIDRINSQGLVTGATYLADSARVVLTGYTPTTAFFIELSNLQNTDFSDAQLSRFEIPMTGSFQVESIEWKEGFTYLIATEGNTLGSPVLYCLMADVNSSTSDALPSYSTLIYPNPTSDKIHIDTPKDTKVYIYNAGGQLKLISLKKHIDVSMLKSGVYWLQVRDLKENIIQNTSIFINGFED